MYSGILYDITIKNYHKIITSTEEHPYYVREKIAKNSKENLLFTEPKWKKANQLTENDYFGMVINKNEIIPEFIVDEKYRNKGIGDKIMKKVIEVARNKKCQNIMLDAYEWNKSAHKLCIWN